MNFYKVIIEEPTPTGVGVGVTQCQHVYELNHKQVANEPSKLHAKAKKRVRSIEIRSIWRISTTIGAQLYKTKQPPKDPIARILKDLAVAVKN